MTSPWFAALSALFLWWFATGALLLVVRRADRRGGFAHARAVIAGVPLLALGVAGAAASLPVAGVGGVYAGFISALAIWGWIELAFLVGIVTGPERRPCPPDLSAGPRFLRAWNTVAHHEIALALGLLALVVVSNGQPNQTALWTFLILWAARVLAKINLHLGVPRINEEFVPARLGHLKSYFTKGPPTVALPLAITGLSFATVCFAERWISAVDPAREVQFALLCALSALALLEHWLMVLPLPDARLWRWMLPAPRPTKD